MSYGAPSFLQNALVTLCEPNSWYGVSMTAVPVILRPLRAAFLNTLPLAGVLSKWIVTLKVPRSRERTGITVLSWLRTASSKAGTTVALVTNDESQYGVVRVLACDRAPQAVRVCARTLVSGGARSDTEL
eukprot:5796398-Prymnesium_polylepis.1